MNDFQIFMDRWLHTQVQQQAIPGLVVAVYQRDEQLFLGSYSASMPSVDSAALHSGQVFNIGSQAKMMTAVLVMKLVESGQLALDDLVVAHVPWLAKHPDNRMRYITLQQLLWHGAGLVREGEQADYWQLGYGFPGRSAFRELVLASSCVLEGGAKLKYSNVGYALLGEVIESASGMEYAAFASRHIIERLGLAHTFVGTPGPDAGVAPAYTRPIGGQRQRVTATIPVRTLAPATGWYTNAHDICAFLRAVTADTDQLLRPDLRQQLLGGVRRHWIPAQDRGTPYGLGFMKQELGGRRMIGHVGAFVSHRSVAFIDPATRRQIVVMACAKDTPVVEIADGIQGVIGHFASPKPARRSADLKPFCGVYENMHAVRYIFAGPEGLLSVPLDDWAPLGMAERLTKVDKNRLHIETAYDLLAEGEDITYTFRADGHVQSINYAGLTMWPEAAYAVRGLHTTMA